MGTIDLYTDDFPHGTPDGFEQGCRGGACPNRGSELQTCKEAKHRFNTDRHYRKLAESGAAVDVLAQKADDAPPPAPAPTRPTARIDPPLYGHNQERAPKPKPVPNPAASVRPVEIPAEHDVAAVDQVDTADAAAAETSAFEVHKKPVALSIDDPQYVHGLVEERPRGYWKGCRCDLCRSAMREYTAAKKRAAVETPTAGAETSAAADETQAAQETSTTSEAVLDLPENITALVRLQPGERVTKAASLFGVAAGNQQLQNELKIAHARIAELEADAETDGLALAVQRDLIVVAEATAAGTIDNLHALAVDHLQLEGDLAVAIAELIQAGRTLEVELRRHERTRTALAETEEAYSVLEHRTNYQAATIGDLRTTIAEQTQQIENQYALLNNTEISLGRSSEPAAPIQVAPGVTISIHVHGPAETR